MRLIPTVRKQRLPKGFSYPLGAEAISEVLGDIPELENARLWFNWRDDYRTSRWRKRIEDRSPVILFTLSYWDYLGYWSLTAYSVPSEFSVFARDRMVTELQKIRRDLSAIRGSSRSFRASIALSLTEAQRAANQRAAGDGRTAVRFQFERQWPATTELIRSK